MDFQNRAGSKPGAGGVASASAANADRRERLKQLALETIDLARDPYFMKNHLGSYECKLCLTLHNNEGNYLAHTQGKRHQTNLLRRAAKEAADAASSASAAAFAQAAARQRALEDARAASRALRVGLPGYKVTKQRRFTDAAGPGGAPRLQRVLVFQLLFPEIAAAAQPRHRFMSAFEQKVEPPDNRFQYLLFAAEPYETVAFKLPNTPVDRREGQCFSNWDKSAKTFTLQLAFLDAGDADGQPSRPAPPPPRPTVRYG